MGEMRGLTAWRSSRLAALVCIAALLPEQSVSGDEPGERLLRPEGHFKVERPADLFPNTAETVYQQIRGELSAGYALARMTRLRNYLTWRRHNTAPYRSATHGARYVNNYSNRKGAAYGRFEEAGELPAGAILVKDSFTATADGGIYPGPMFVMEKMREGFNLASNDWRYTMIMPDGSLFGETKGVNASKVDFCVGCHAARDEYDHLFFVPQEYRLTPLSIER